MTRFRIVSSLPSRPSGDGDDDGAGRNALPGRGRRLFTPEFVIMATTVTVGLTALAALLAIVVAAWRIH